MRFMLGGKVMVVNNKQVENTQTYKNSKGRHRFLKFVIIMLVVVLIAGGILFFLLVQDDNKGKYSAEPSVDIFSKLIVASLTTKEVNISEEEINGFLAYALSKYEINMDSNIIIDGIYTDINPETNFAKLYIPITYNKVSLGLTGTLDIHLNESSSKIDINLSNTKVGKLPIPSKLVAKFIAERFPEKITYNNTTISFDSNINFYFKEDNIALEITECEIKNKALAVRTKGVNNVVDKFIKDKFGISISNDSVINSWIDGISNLLVG